jgi:hypothetical protein
LKKESCFLLLKNVPFIVTAKLECLRQYCIKKLSQTCNKTAVKRIHQKRKLLRELQREKSVGGGSSKKFFHLLSFFSSEEDIES